ncbi:galactosyltransferase-related protein [Rhodohalobacter sulfatireducens]|uniref:Galactosyltransferase-related protein n=1 Tax=Rhodohalobacter sulfatireducens TaxID=2911366 RepID=A0ABS9KBI2_9BACT|nr:galactosyltransferase-related protein [Rhodohalobacter sulfatireducens]MCG2588208.1 galactosyltransferase-related protein [Rhodohalobacter sulfatireducens]
MMDNRVDFKDVTFLIRIKVDSMDRIENCMMVIDFLSDHFKTNIHVLEVRNYKNRILEKLLPNDVLVTCIEDYDPVFHQTKYLNRMAQKCQTPYLSIWDADVLAPPDQMIESVELLRKQEVDFITPYKAVALDTTELLRELYLKKRDIQVLQENQNKMIPTRSPNPSVGGAFFANKETYFEAGMENERFYGWGAEDDERIIRWELLGYRYKRLDGVIYHLTHQRGKNSTFYTNKKEEIARSELYKILAMSNQELEEYVNRWNHEKPN